MNQSMMSQLLTLQKLLQRDIYLFKQTFFHRLRMSLYWIVLTVFTTKMFMPAMGLHDFAPFILISSAVSYGIFFAMQNAIGFVEDLTGNQAILYELSLPIPQWLIFFKFALSTMLQTFCIAMSIIPCCMIILVELHPFHAFSLWKFLTIFICSSIFYGCFALIFTATLKNMQQIENVWLRIIFPMWYLGCWQFPWAKLYSISPLLAYLDLLNPMTFIMEAGRNATIDPTGTLPFSLCCIMILVYAALSCILGIYWMKKRLDCI